MERSSWDESSQPTWITAESFLAKVRAAARDHSTIRYSITNWCFALVCGQDPKRVPSASTALGGARKNGWNVAAAPGTRPVRVQLPVFSELARKRLCLGEVHTFGFELAQTKRLHLKQSVFKILQYVNVVLS